MDGYRRAIWPSISILRLKFDDSSRVLRDGTLVVGRRPARVLRLTAAGGRCVSAWCDGAPVGDGAGERALAGRLIEAELAHPVHDVSPFTAADVAVVIPARDRAGALAECLRSLGPAAEVVVVDDCSTDPEAIKAAARAARVVRLARASGPAAARNAGLAATTAPLVAFIDDDALPRDGWLAALLAHFGDERVGAVAPRVRAASGQGPLDAYEAARSPLDMGPRPGIVGPARRVRFVPATALVVRRDAVAGGFDESLRFGEDVDLVWRLSEAGWTVRYEPAGVVEHPRRAGARAWLRQRLEYGSSAAPLAVRHPGALSHLVVPWFGPPWRRDLAPLIAAAELRAARQMLDAAWRAYPPALLGAALGSRRARRLAAASLAISIAAEWLERRPRLDPLRFGALRTADDLAYAAGVWLGCLRNREAGPLIPRIAQPSSRSGGAETGAQRTASARSSSRRTDRR